MKRKSIICIVLTIFSMLFCVTTFAFDNSENGERQDDISLMSLEDSLGNIYYDENDDISFVVNGTNLPLKGYEPGMPWDNCFTFAELVYDKIWNTSSQGNDLLREVYDDNDLRITEKNTKKYIMASELGAHIRIEDGKGIYGVNEHSMILVDKDKYGFTVYHGNVNGAIYFTYYTYKGFAEHYEVYKYFAYITWPNAPAYEKKEQNISVSKLQEQVYGNSDIKLEVKPDIDSELIDFTFKSSDSNVAEIDGDGNISIKNAGETDITVNQSGDEFYKSYTNTQKLIVNKAKIKVMADDKAKKVGKPDPELTYTYTGNLFGSDEFTGSLERTAGEDIGSYKIKQGSLKLTDNYDIDFTEANFEIVEKTPQNITVSAIEEKTYGDEPFKIEVIPDSETNLSAFAFESDNKDVAEVSEDGTVTIIGAGEANITVTEPGNEEYAAFKKTQKLIVKPIKVTINDINIDEKTAEIEGFLETDSEITLDFDKIQVEVGEAINDENVSITLKNFVLKGEGAQNYSVTNELIECVTDVKNIAVVNIKCENGTATGGGSYYKGSDVTMTATPEKNYKFTGWYANGKLLSSTEEYTFTATENIDIEARFTKQTTNNTGGGTGGGGGGGFFGGGYIGGTSDMEPSYTEPPSNTTPSSDGGSQSLYGSLPFTDVSASDWYYAGVDYAYANGLMNGTSATRFEPEATMTRGMLVTVLGRAEGVSGDSGSAFSDVDPNEYYAPYIAWASGCGIVNGVGGGMFAPDDTVTREQIAKIFKGYYEYFGEATNLSSAVDYADAHLISDWAVPGVAFCKEKGLMQGKEGNMFDPQGGATRAEAATILMRAGIGK